MAKAGEKAYFKLIGEDGRRMTVNKPFSDKEAGSLLAQIGTIISLIPENTTNILDLGCGSGWTSSFFSKLGLDVTGQDISPEAIGLAKKHFGNKNTQFICSDYENLKFKKEFDVAVFFDCLHHAEDVPAALNAVYKSLKPGGCVIISEPGKGHGKSEHSLEAVRKYGVAEEDMPPTKIIYNAQKAGFKKWKVYPDIGMIQRAIVKKNFNRSILKYIPGSLTRWFAVQYLLIFKKSFQGIVVLYRESV